MVENETKSKRGRKPTVINFPKRGNFSAAGLIAQNNRGSKSVTAVTVHRKIKEALTAGVIVPAKVKKTGKKGRPTVLYVCP